MTIAIERALDAGELTGVSLRNLAHARAQIVRALERVCRGPTIRRKPLHANIRRMHPCAHCGHAWSHHQPYRCNGASDCLCINYCGAVHAKLCKKCGHAVERHTPYCMCQVRTKKLRELKWCDCTAFVPKGDI